MRRLLKALVLFLLLAPLLSGCTMVGPNYQKPKAPVMPDYMEYEDPLLDTNASAAFDWWKTAFNDPILDRLVKTALAQNLTLRSAGLRVLQARQKLAIAIGNQYPQQQQFGGQAGIEGIFSSPAYEIYDLGFNLAWEVDVWGRFKRQVESAAAALDASVGSYDGIMLSLIAEVAQSYLLIRATQERIAVARYNLEIQKESVRITTAKFEGGEISVLDVDQAKTLFYNTGAFVASLELSLQQFKNSLSILLGRPPHDMSALLGSEQPVPAVTPEIAVGMPQDLIRRRPDIRTAERQLAAQSAQIGFAVSELYPHFGLGGAIGTSVSTNSGLNFSDLFSAQTLGFKLFGAFQWNIFQYGRLKNNVRLQDALFQQLLEDYRQTVLQAQGEVENAIVAFLKSQQQLAALQAAASAAQHAVDVSTVQYRDGEVPFNTVFNTQQSLVSQLDQFAAIQGTVATNLVDLYKSLGGGWEVRQTQNPLHLIPEQTQKEMLNRTHYWDKTFNKD
jgi:NodT family efflux transporter outer membrane factor (OMF) lipoprotein